MISILILMFFAGLTGIMWGLAFHSTLEGLIMFGIVFLAFLILEKSGSKDIYIE